MNEVILVNSYQVELPYEKPFSFEKTFYKPSRFKTDLELYDGKNFYMSFNFKQKAYGLKFTMLDSVKLMMEIYSNNRIEANVVKEIIDEISFRFSLNKSYDEFYHKFSSDKFLKQIVKRNYGKHIGSLYSLYENLMISVFLQNATIQRTIDMTYNMLSAHGKLISFDGIKLFATWTPRELSSSDEELRMLKVGYRAKNILRITEYFCTNDISEKTLRKLSDNPLEKELLKIYGVGKQTVFYSMLGLYHRTGYLKHIPLWERKILSKYVFHEDLCEERDIVSWFHEKFENWCGFALSMILEDIFFQHKRKPYEWLQEIMNKK